MSKMAVPTTHDMPQAFNQLIFHEVWQDTAAQTDVPPDMPMPGALIKGKSAITPAVRSGSDRTLVLDTAPLAGDSQPIVNFGRGFYGPEHDASARGDRWTNGRGHAYFVTRLEAEEIHVDFYSPFPDATRLELLVSRLDDPAKQTFVPELHAEFWGKCNEVARLAIPVTLQPAELYRLTLISPAFIPDQASAPGDCLGLAVVAAEIVGRPFATAMKSVPGLSAAPVAQPKPEEALQPSDRLLRVQRITMMEDITRPSPDGVLRETANIAWFSKLLQYPVKRAVGPFPVCKLESPGAGEPDWRRLYQLNGYSTCESDWARLYGRTRLAPDSLELLDQAFSGALVLGFELPDVLVRYFLHRGIPYIDSIVHPARFLDDIFLGFRTNVPEVFEALRTYAIPEEQLYVQAGIHAATIARMRPVPASPNSCLLLGQTRIDKSLLCGDRVLSLDDFGNELRRLAREHGRIYFKRHPYAQKDPAIITQLQQDGLLEITEANTYALLCNENISKVVSISSGALYEAQYFGKEAQYLYQPCQRLAKETYAFDPWAFVGVYDAFYTPRFWADLLAAVCPVDNCPEVQVPAKTSRLRTSLQLYWGYNFLDHDILQNNLRGKQITDAAAVL
jgi:hypothetical protein